MIEPKMECHDFHEPQFFQWTNNFTFTTPIVSVGQVRIFPTNPTGSFSTMRVWFYYLNGTWVNVYGATPTYGAWNSIVSANSSTFSQVSVEFYNNDIGAKNVYINEFDFQNKTLSIAVTGNDSVATLTGNSTSSSLTVGASNVATTNFTIPNTSSNWLFNTNNAMPYIEYIKIYVGGNLKGYWSWQYASTFTDQSGNGNTMTPTFRTNGTTNITASVISQAPTSTSTGPADNVTGGVTIIGSVPTAPGIFASGVGSYPMKGELTAMATSTRIPYDALAKTLAIGSAILVFIIIFVLTHRPDRGMRGSLLFASSGALLILIYWWRAGGGVIEGWQLIPFGVFVVLLLLWRNPNTTPV